MNYVVESFEHNGLTVRIEYDSDTESPREWGNLGEMVCWHRRYDLGDKHHFREPDDFSAFLKESPSILLSLYLYDHSDITINTTGFSCPWDSGQVGYIYVTLEDVRKEYSVKRVSKKLRERVAKQLKAEVDVYDTYLRGEVYGYVIEDADGEHIDSCYGFYGLDCVREEATKTAEYFTAKHKAA